MARAPQTAKPAIDLIEEAIALLRGAPPPALLCYYLGSVPFVLALLYFWAEMSRSAFARSRLAGESLALTILYVWMKAWQALAAQALRRHLMGGNDESERDAGRAVDVRRFIGLAMSQGTIHALALIFPTMGLIVLRAVADSPSSFGLAFVAFPLTLLGLPLALVFFSFYFAFFQTVTCLAVDARPGAPGRLRRAFEQTALWPKQCAVVFVYLALFGLFVYIDLIMAIRAAPEFVKMFTGIDNVFTRGDSATFNSTFLASTLGLAYLCLDPLAKAVYLLRCHYGDSLHTGAALRAELLHLKRAAAPALLAVALLALAGSAHATPQSPGLSGAAGAGAPATAVAPDDLGRAIGRTLQEPRYSWRMPRNPSGSQQGTDASIGGSFIDSVLRFIDRTTESIRVWLRDKLKKYLNRREPTMPTRLGPTSFSMDWTRLLLYILIAVLLVGLIVILIQGWRRRSALPRLAVAMTLPPAPDLQSDDVSADQLPTDEWFALARDLMNRGELRLAMRALFLASLAACAQSNLLMIRKSKSNREYARELDRRAHARPELLAAFGLNLQTFERVWYGEHPIDDAAMREFIARYERIRGLAV